MWTLLAILFVALWGYVAYMTFVKGKNFFEDIKRLFNKGK